MFSYRHAFHAGNHADVLKHTVLIATLQHLLKKETPITVVDTHAGAGLYRLDDNYATTSGEAAEGIAKLLAHPIETLDPLLRDYMELIATFNSSVKKTVYPGSPFIAQHLLRESDKLKLFELHPTDSRALVSNVSALKAGRQVVVCIEDSFENTKKFLPPLSRRGLVLCDPSYEIKSDYAKVGALITDSLKRFATGTYAVWYPVIHRREADDLPRKLKAVAGRAEKPWLHARLTIKDAPGQLGASGMFLINPPYTLKASLQPALHQLVELLGLDQSATSLLEAGE